MMSLLGCLAITEGYIVACLLPPIYRRKVTLSLKQRVGSLEQLADVSRKWTTARNAQSAKINWCFDVTQARTRLARLYP
jgi:hypothetical protein